MELLEPKIESYSERTYIEEKLLNSNNHKKLKILEEDITSFEDSFITLNVANLFMDYTIYCKNKFSEQRVLFLPNSILKKFSQSSVSTLEKIIELSLNQRLESFHSIVLVHQDKFKMDSYSLIVAANIQNFRSPTNVKSFPCIILAK